MKVPRTKPTIFICFHSGRAPRKKTIPVLRPQVWNVQLAFFWNWKCLVVGSHRVYPIRVLILDSPSLLSGGPVWAFALIIGS